MIPLSRWSLSSTRTLFIRWSTMSLQYARQLRRRIDVDEISRHHVCHRSRHQFSITRNHQTRRHGKTAQEIELGDQADNVTLFLNGERIEAIFCELHFKI